MRQIVLAVGLLLSLIAFAQTTPEKPDPWTKVEQLRSGTELRIFKTGSTQPVLASFADLNEDNVIVLIKNTETAVAKSDIDRIEARTKPGSRVKTETSEAEKAPDTTSLNPRDHSTGPTSSSSTNLSFGSKGDFLTVYRRTAASTKP